MLFRSFKKGFGPFAPEVYRFPFPNVYRRPEGLTAEAWVEWHVANLEHAFTAIVDPSHVAAVVIEPVLGEGGFLPVPAPFLRRLRALCDAHGMLLVCDEVQFYTVEQCDQLARVVDELSVDVYAFGLITDFRGLLFDGTRRMLEVADERVEMQVEARCWCGSRATHNARVVNGVLVYEGETVVVGDTGDAPEPMFGDVVRYELLCRKHYLSGEMK